MLALLSRASVTEVVRTVGIEDGRWASKTDGGSSTPSEISRAVPQMDDAVVVDVVFGQRQPGRVDIVAPQPRTHTERDRVDEQVQDVDQTLRKKCADEGAASKTPSSAMSLGSLSKAVSETSAAGHECPLVTGSDRGLVHAECTPHGTTHIHSLGGVSASLRAPASRS